MFKDSSILVTGATGSFGQVCVRTLIEKHSPKKVIILSRDELKQFRMRESFSENELRHIRFFLGDVRDRDRLRMAFRGVDYVIHAAALKQVPALEYNPGEAVKTNILGATNIIEAALDSGVKRVIALSTDKACRPINLYGATKLASDKLFIAANNLSGSDGCIFSVVRYGNVLGSRGSVVPLFRRLVEEGASELPITSNEMTRFFLTLEEGVDFVLKCFGRMWGAEVFIPKIPSMKIADLAEAIGHGLKTKEIGIRPGEKLHEDLCPRETSHMTLEFDDFFIIKPDFTFSGLVDYSTSRCGQVGKSVNPTFEYRSDTNPQMLSVNQIRELLQKVE